MPADMSKYSDNWNEIRARILRRAGGSEDDPRVGARCEMCGVINYSVYVDGVLFDICNTYKWARLIANRAPGGKVIVLTIAHINDPDPMNVADDNLMALCQRCHNLHDIDHRKQNRAKTRRGKIVQAGQLVLV